MWFVKFYAPYCGYCKKMEPTWNHVAQSLYNTKLVLFCLLTTQKLIFYAISSIRVGKVDCTRFKSVCQAFKVQGYPTIIFIRGSNEFVYNGERTKDELVHFVIRMSGPPVRNLIYWLLFTRNSSFVYETQHCFS